MNVRKPIIGVFSLWDDEKESLWMLPGYLNGLRAAGAVPLILPLELDETEALQLYALCDGLLFTGGHDVAPARYGAEQSPLCGTVCRARDELEALLFRHAFADDKPVLGICRGIQLINALRGGTLYQDLDAELPGALEHHMTAPYDRVCHEVRIERDGMLHTLLGTEKLGVNSYHHQGVREVAAGLQVEATAPDGLIEALSCPERRFLLAVQWHPEFNYRTEPTSEKIFRAFVKSCEQE